MESDIEMEEKNNNNLIYVLVLIIGVLIGVAGVFIAEKYVGKKEGNEPTKIEEKEKNDKESEGEKEEKDNEKVIIDSYIIKNLDKKLEILNGYKADLVSPAPGLYKNINSKDMKDGEKLYMILFYNDKNEKMSKATKTAFNNLTGENITGWSGTVDNLTDLYISDDGMYHYMEKSKVDQEYKELFGNLPNTTKVINGYPNYYYEPNAEAYFQVARAGGTCGLTFDQYIYSYTQDNENAYIYTSIGYYSCQDGLYKDYETKEEIANLEERTNSKTPAKDFMDKLDKYRVVFKKDVDNYIFDRVEKL